MTAEIITAMGEWNPDMTWEEYAATQVTRTSDPNVVAKVIVSRGEQFPADPLHPMPKVVIIDPDENVQWWLDVAQAFAVADRIRELAQDILDGRPLRRLAAVDEQLREIDE